MKEKKAYAYYERGRLVTRVSTQPPTVPYSMCPKDHLGNPVTDANILKIIQVQDPNDPSQTINKAVVDPDKKAELKARKQKDLAEREARNLNRAEIRLRLKDAYKNFTKLKRSEKDDVLLDILELISE